MPTHARGAHYIGKVHGFLHCHQKHNEAANELFSEMSKEGVNGTRNTTCYECGAYIQVSRKGAEWENRIFSGKGPEM
jgi:hypothetical protein